MIPVLFWTVIALSIVFGMTNGFIVGGSLVSVVITTRALTPLTALLCVAVCEIGGVFLLGQQVARMLGQQLVVFPAGDPPARLLVVLVSAAAGALGWNLAMWRMALPTSSGHALVGGLTGSFLGAYGFGGVHWGVFARIFVLLGVLPLVGSFSGYVLARAGYWVGEFLAPAWGRIFRGMQIFALAGVALVHGSNDGQKAMAVIALAMAARGAAGAPQVIPWPVTFVCGLALAVGLLFGSRRIIQNVGQRLFRIQPLQGVCAQTSTMLLVGISSWAGYPMSSSQLISTSLLGAGVAVHPRGIRWDLVGEIGLAWLITLPMSGLLAASFVWMMQRMWHVVP
jgi:PiT family inorganic phosphate transporter